ncbi:MAG: hypothetical protein ACNA8W_13280 [Bradymonadaceae bacterium]
MMRIRVAASLLIGIALLFGGSAFAQDGNSVVVLKFTALDVDQEVMDHFYMELHEHIQAHSEMNVAAGGEVTINDLTVMAGCDEPTTDCLVGLQDFVEGSRLVFGTVHRTNDVYVFDAQMFDFATGEFIREISGVTLQGDQGWIRRGTPAIVEGLLYGDVGELSVEVSGSDSAHVLVNGQERGLAPVTLTGLALGETIVVVRNAEGEEKMERVILRRNRAEELEIVFDSSDSVAEPGAVSGTTNSFLIPAIAVSAVGVAGIVVGFVGQTQLSGLENEANTLVGGRSALNENEVNRAATLQNDMNSAHTLRVLGFSVGGVALAAGAGLFYKAFAGSEDKAPAAASLLEGMEVHIGPTGMAVGGSF